MFMCFINISPAMYSAAVMQRDIITNSKPFLSQSVSIGSRLSSPAIRYSRQRLKPYRGRHGPARKPGFIHLLAEKNLLNRTSSPQPARLPAENKNARIRKLLILTSPFIFFSCTDYTILFRRFQIFFACFSQTF